jgi:hypothetical protein
MRDAILSVLVLGWFGAAGVLGLRYRRRPPTRA